MNQNSQRTEYEEAMEGNRRAPYDWTEEEDTLNTAHAIIGWSLISVSLIGLGILIGWMIWG